MSGASQYPSEQDLGHVVAHRERQMPSRRRRVESRLRPQRAANFQQNVPHGVDEPVGDRRQHHLAADRHQQFVPEMMAEPGEGAAHGRLAQIQPVAGAGHVPLGQQRIERDEQIQIEQVQIHRVTYRSCRYLASGRRMSTSQTAGTKSRP